MFTGGGRAQSSSYSDDKSYSGVSSLNDSCHECPPAVGYGLDRSVCLIPFSDKANPERLPYTYCRHARQENGSHFKGQEHLLQRKILVEGNSSFTTGDVTNLKSKVSLKYRRSKDRKAGIGAHLCSDNENKEFEFVYKKQQVRNGIAKKYVNYIYHKDVGDDNNGYDDATALDLSKDQYGCVLGDSEVYRKEKSLNKLYNKNDCEDERQKGRCSLEREEKNMEMPGCWESSNLVDENPIDYSQLSSRWKEPCDGDRKATRPHTAEDSLEHISKLTAESLHQAMSREVNRSPILTPNVEFTLSPKINEITRSQTSAGLPRKASRNCDQTSSLASAFQNSSKPGNHELQCLVTFSSALSSHTRIAHKTNMSEVSVAKFEHSGFKSKVDCGKTAKKDLVYHPKLKYLVAVSRITEKDVQKGKQSVPSTEDTRGYYPFNNRDTFTSHNRYRQIQIHVPLNSCKEDKFSTSATLNKIPSVPTTHNISDHDYVPSPGADTSPLKFNNDSEQGATDVDPMSIIVSPKSRIPMLHGLHGTLSEFPTTKSLGNSILNSLGEFQTGNSLWEQHALDSKESQISDNTKSGTEKYACEDCPKRYSTASNLARHRQIHKHACAKKARKCPYCEKTYISQAAYTMHARTHRQGNECPFCGKHFSRPWLLQGHIRTHTGEKPFPCSQCGKHFADKSNLRAHIQTHAKDKPYVCGRCGKAFALKSYLSKHEASSCMTARSEVSVFRQALMSQQQRPPFQVTPRSVFSAMDSALSSVNSVLLRLQPSSEKERTIVLMKNRSDIDILTSLSQSDSPDEAGESSTVVWASNTGYQSKRKKKAGQTKATM